LKEEIMQIGELAQRLGVPYRSVKYVLERGAADRWVKRTPGTGHHRDMSGGESFALGLLLLLKQNGLRLPFARHVVGLIEEGVRGVAQALGWESLFQPFRGELKTEHEWVVEIGDSKTVRLGTNANPSRAGRMEYFDWVTVGKRRRVLKDFQPCVTICIDLSRLAELVRS
jgi:hypothetical protein